MKSLKWKLAMTVLIIWIPLFVAFWLQSLLFTIILSLWIAGVLVVGAIAMYKGNEQEQRAMAQGIEQTAIKTLNHHRHDWMNDLQILYGYIQLNKIDKSKEYVGRIKEKMTIESKISKLGVPPLIFYLQSFRTTGSNLILEVEIAENLSLSEILDPQEGDELTTMIAQTIRAYQYSGLAAWGETRKLILRFYQEEDDVIVRFEVDGGHSQSTISLDHIHQGYQSKKIKAEQLQMADASFQLRVMCET